jgi:hypothetical protein
VNNQDELACYFLGVSVFSVPSVLKLFFVVRNGFNTEGTENTENANSRNFVLSSSKLEQRSELRDRKLFRACIR